MDLIIGESHHLFNMAAIEVLPNFSNTGTSWAAKLFFFISPSNRGQIYSFRSFKDRILLYIRFKTHWFLIFLHFMFLSKLVIKAAKFGKMKYRFKSYLSIGINLYLKAKSDHPLFPFPNDRYKISSRKGTEIKKLSIAKRTNTILK